VLKFFLVILFFEYAKIGNFIDTTSYFAKKTPIFNNSTIKILRINPCDTEKSSEHREGRQNVATNGGGDTGLVAGLKKNVYFCTK